MPQFAIIFIVVGCVIWVVWAVEEYEQMSLAWREILSDQTEAVATINSPINAQWPSHVA